MLKIDLVLYYNGSFQMGIAMKCYKEALKRAKKKHSKDVKKFVIIL